jgi:BlaI family transcriptional regulator, penicillinase repressor
MAPTRQQESQLTPAQLELMNLFWEHGELSVAQVRQILSKTRSVARNTVQTMLTRLVEKGWLQTRTEGKAFLFRASRPRKSTLRAMVGQLLDTAFDGSASGLVMTLLETRSISPDEAASIRRLIDEKQEGKK